MAEPPHAAEELAGCFKMFRCGSAVAGGDGLNRAFAVQSLKQIAFGAGQRLFAPFTLEDGCSTFIANIQSVPQCRHQTFE